MFPEDFLSMPTGFLPTFGREIPRIRHSIPDTTRATYG